MMRGPAPFPTVVKQLRGTLRKHRSNPHEPSPPRARPRAPQRLSPVAAAAWRELVHILDGMRVLTSADTIALEAAATALADLREARAALGRPLIDEQTAEDGTIKRRVLAAGGSLTYAAGNAVKARPELALIADADRRLHGWLAKFGMTPSDRQRVSAPNGSGNAFDEF